MFYVGFTNADAPDLNAKFTQDCFISFVLSDLKKYAQGLRGWKYPIELAVHMNNSRCHSGHEVADKMRRNHMMRLDHPRYPPDLSACDF
jgi:hypothetical protein